MKLYKTRYPAERLNVRFVPARRALRVGARGAAAYFRLPPLSAVVEAVLVVGLTVCLFRAGVAYAYAERGYFARGGEYILLTIPGLYYSGKKTLLDWIADLRELRGRK